MSGKSDPSVCAAVWLGDAAALKRMLWPKSGGKPTKEGRDSAFVLANSRGKDGESPLHVAGATELLNYFILFIFISCGRYSGFPYPRVTF